MAAITVTILANNKINVDFGYYSNVQASTGMIPKKRCFHKDEIAFSLNNNYIEAHILYSGLTMPVNHDGSNNALKVDSVNSVAPTSLEDLYNLLIVL
jgi:Zn-dependent membrane protease YugP